MTNNEPDAKADKKAVVDRQESIGLMEPMVVAEGSRFRTGLVDLALELASRSSGFRRSLPIGLVSTLADLVRAMNCYYSNLIEGHQTHPVDIERALRNDYSRNPEKRNLQLEAKAHIATQQWIDQGHLRGRATSLQGICEIHERFYRNVPDDLLWIADPETGRHERVVAGEVRQRDVKVGAHIPVSAGSIPRFLRRFEQVYGSLGKSDTVIAAAAAHHRFLWIHPFLDGNGRVARLMSYAMLDETLDTGGLWSIARGFARSVGTYKTHLAHCDQSRRNDLDGRGHLSEEALANFTRYFLETCLDQVRFMENLMQPDRLRHRITLWANEETVVGSLPPKASVILEALLYRGELPRGEIANLLGVGERQARRVVSALVQLNVIVSGSSRAPLHLAFPAALASRWMPGLFPEMGNHATE